MIEELGDRNKQQVIIWGSEYCDLSKYRKNKFDLVFTWPPYFDYETYTRSTQWMNWFSNYENWFV